MITDWSPYPNFTKKEFDCTFTGMNDMQPQFMEKLQALRTKMGIGFTVTSGYRAPTHPIEAKKPKPGEHTQGLCADVYVAMERRLDLVVEAYKLGFTRVGVANGFIHLGIAKESDGFPSPRIWSY